MEGRISALENRIEDLRKELYRIKESRDGLNLQARKWREERDRIHKGLKQSISKVAESRAKLKAVNERVEVLKTSLDEGREKHREKRLQLHNLNEKLKDLAAKGSYMNSQELENKIKEIDWKIQTTSLPLEEEKLLIEKVKILESHLAIHRQVMRLKDEMKSLRNGMNAADEEIPQLIEQRRSIRQEILEYSKRISELKTEADKMHKNYLECRDEGQKFHSRYLEILNQFKALQLEIAEIEEETKAKRTLDLESDLEKKALEKLKDRKKLTFDEFKILAEKGKL